MNHNRKRGIPAVAYAAPSSVSPLSCSLLFKHSLARAQATLSLQFNIAVSGYNKLQAITLLYDASNLLPSSLGPATIPLPPTRLDEIARHGNPQIRTLSLRLKTSCPVWCPPGSGLLRPSPGTEGVMEQLAHLAKSTEVGVVFDFNWLRRQHHVFFTQLVEQPESLGAFATRRRDGDRCLDWTVFDLSLFEAVKEAVETEAEATEPETEDEAPPSYVESHKRPRCASTTPPSPSFAKRDRKRALRPSAHIPTSPTERASSAPRSPISPHSHAAPADLQRAVEKAVATLLPGVLERVLPSLLQEHRSMPTSPSPSASASISSQTSVPPPPLSSVGALFNSRIASHVEAQLHSIYDHTLSHASYLRNTADVEFLEVLDDYKLDMKIVRDDALAELDREVVDKLDRFRADATDVVEDVGDRVDERAYEICDDVRERLDALDQREKASLQRARAGLERDRAWLVWEREVLERDRRGFEKLTAQVERRKVRLGSAPL